MTLRAYVLACQVFEARLARDVRWFNRAIFACLVMGIGVVLAATVGGMS